MPRDRLIERRSATGRPGRIARRGLVMSAAPLQKPCSAGCRASWGSQARSSARDSAGATPTSRSSCDATRADLVIRRPPDAAISASAAQGVRREFRMLSALAGHARVPRAVGFCEDTTVIGQPFAVVEYRAGCLDHHAHSRLRTPTRAATIASLGRGAGRCDRDGACARLAGAAARSRRATRTATCSARSSAGSRRVPPTAVRELPSLERIGRWLLDERPTAAPARVVHGDYHLDNTLFRTDTAASSPRSSTGSSRRSAIR